MSFIRITLLSCLLIIAQSTAAQNIRFEASTDAEEVLLGSYIQVEFSLKNTDGTNFSPPSFEDFNVLSGPSRSSSLSSYNGVVSKSLSYSYVLQPKKEGILTIGPASIRAQKQDLKTNPLQIKVIRGSGQSIDPDMELYVLATVSDSVGYIGQQIILDYELYYRPNVRSVRFLTEHEYDGFYSLPLQIARSAEKRKIIEGVEYKTKLIKRIALFPQQTGTYTIDPAIISLGIPLNNRRQSFFLQSQLVGKEIQSNPLQLQILDSPKDTTIVQSGAVGQYKMNISKPKSTITTDDAIIINMEIIGDGDNKTVIAPKWKVPEGLEMYDPNIVQDEILPSSSKITHRKIFEYLIVANRPGKYILKPTFTYFNPDSSRFVSIQKSVGPINVLQGSDKEPVISQANQEVISDIYSKTELKRRGDGLYGKSLHLISLLLLSFSSIGLIAYKSYLVKSGKLEESYILKKHANVQVMSRLSHAEDLMQDKKEKAFFEEISYALRKYLSDKHNIPALHSKKEEIELVLKEKFNDEIIQAIMDIFKQTELAIYAPLGSMNMAATLQQAKELISKIEASELI
ncbi:MAG: protein BatD [Saprospiraceae bacterium]|nr:protein BatD [Saprospiraceae bacterium]